MPTYTPLQSIELITSTNSVTFSNLPQTYQDLVIVTNSTTDGGTQNLRIAFNGDSVSSTSTPNYSSTRLITNGSGANNERQSNFGYIMIGDINTTRCTTTTHFMNYSNTTTNKTVLSRSGSGSDYQGIYVGLWRQTSAINSIQIANQGSINFTSGTTFDLYGISPVAADTAQAFGGTEIYYDSSYVYHVFKGSGTFTPYRNLTVDALVIAGGGGTEGEYGGGGGGAGGLLAYTSQSVTSGTNYAITVGAGGGKSANGSNSQFGSLTASIGGGRGGRWNVGNGGNGGSGGGGGSQNNTGSFTGGTGTVGQGNNGGNGSTGGAGVGGGGGGAGAAGANAASSSSAGAGGAGSSSYSSWGLATGTGHNVSGTVWFAGGGGGGGFTASGAAGGNGGGGTGGNDTANPSNVNGMTNVGGGAGGTSGGFNANGGSGIVIVRYAR